MRAAMPRGMPIRVKKPAIIPKIEPRRAKIKYYFIRATTPPIAAITEKIISGIYTQ